MTTSTKIRQAAAILNSIPSEQADLILERLPTRDLRCLIRAMRELDEVADGQLFYALELFARDLSNSATPPAACEPSEPKVAAQEVIARDPLTIHTRCSHFGFLTDLSAQQVGQLLSDEHPKTIAIVLTLLPPDFATDVLATIDPIVRVSAYKRICEPLSPTPYELDTLHIALRKRVAKIVAAPTSEPDVQFEDLTCMTDRQWQTLTRYVNTACWAPALKTAPRGIRERVLNNMAPEPRRILRREIESLIDVAPDQIKHARAEIMDTCRTLCEAGKLELRRF